MMQNRYAAALAILALAVFPIRTFGQPIVCVPLPPDPCGGKSGCVVLDDEWQITVEPTGQIDLSGQNISRDKLQEDAAVWAKEGTWPIVVRGRPGTSYAQIASIVTMLRTAGIRTAVSCIEPQS